MTNEMTDTKIAHFRNVREKMNAAENFIIEEGAKMGVKLTKAQAATFANIVLRVYNITD